jgi:hypothetical protein
MTIRSAYESITVENSTHVLEVDLVVVQIAFALFRIPSEFANVCEQPLQVFRHSKIAPQARVSIRLIPLRFAMTDLKSYSSPAFVVVVTPFGRRPSEKNKSIFDRTSKGCIYRRISIFKPVIRYFDKFPAPVNSGENPADSDTLNASSLYR